jgi:hypothetical protein
MKTGFLCILSVTLVILFMAALQIIPAHAGPRSVSPEHRLSIAEPRNSGQWKGNDLAVEYSYSKDQGKMDISGNVEFSTSMVLGYARMEDFRLSAIFLDENGRVLQEIGLVTNRGSFEPLSFKRKIDLPANAAFMAFSYQGKGIDSGGNGVSHTSFYFSPVR